MAVLGDPSLKWDVPTAEPAAVRGRHHRRRHRVRPGRRPRRHGRLPRSGRPPRRHRCGLRGGGVHRSCHPGRGAGPAAQRGRPLAVGPRRHPHARRRPRSPPPPRRAPRRRSPTSRDRSVAARRGARRAGLLARLAPARRPQDGPTTTTVRGADARTSSRSPTGRGTRRGRRPGRRAAAGDARVLVVVGDRRAAAVSTSCGSPRRARPSPSPRRASGVAGRDALEEAVAVGVEALERGADRGRRRSSTSSLASLLSRNAMTASSRSPGDRTSAWSSPAVHRGTRSTRRRPA